MLFVGYHHPKRRQEKNRVASKGDAIFDWTQGSRRTRELIHYTPGQNIRKSRSDVILKVNILLDFLTIRRTIGSRFPYTIQSKEYRNERPFSDTPNGARMDKAPA
jgi:hypothetical protein